MNLRAWIDPRVAQVTVAGVRAYLLQRGWVLKPYPRPELLVFEGPADDGEPIIQVLPSSERMLDYRMRVEELIGALSVLEDRPAVDILSDILNESPAGMPAPNGAAASPAPTSPRTPTG
jgi:hypothetical protein